MSAVLEAPVHERTARRATTRTHAPIPMSRLAGVELRKMFDTRAGFWLLMSVGILALVGGLIPFLGWVMVPFALTAVGLGIAGMSRARTIGEGKGLAIAGLVTGVLALLAILAWTIAIALAGAVVSNPTPKNTTSRPGLSCAILMHSSGE